MVRGENCVGLRCYVYLVPLHCEAADVSRSVHWLTSQVQKLRAEYTSLINTLKSQTYRISHTEGTEQLKKETQIRSSSSPSRNGGWLSPVPTRCGMSYQGKVP